MDCSNIRIYQIVTKGLQFTHKYQYSINMGIIQVKMLQIQPENHFAIEIHVKFMDQVLKQNIIIKQYNLLLMFA